MLIAIANDDLIPILKIFKVSEKASLLANGILCFVTIMIGSLDAVVPIVSICFLLCYGFVNVACFLLDWLGSPNWRPKWKYYNKLTSFGGVVFCVAIMVMISWWAAIISSIMAICLHQYIDRRTKERDWGDGIEGIRSERARDALLKLDKYKTNIKNWRPRYLALGSVDEEG